MKQVVILFLIFACTSVRAQEVDTVVTTPNDSLEAKIIRLLELSRAKQNFVDAIGNMIELQKQQPGMADIPEEFWTEFSKEAATGGWNAYLPDVVAIYRENYTEAEIDHQLDYLSDPMTQGMLEKQSTVMRQSMQAGAKIGQEIGMDIATRLQEAQEKN